MQQLMQIPDDPNQNIEKILRKILFISLERFQKKLIKDNKVVFLKTHNALLKIEISFYNTKFTLGVIYIVSRSKKCHYIS